MKPAVSRALYVVVSLRAAPLCGGSGYGAWICGIPAWLKKKYVPCRYSVGCQRFQDVLKDVDV